jgi:hypothetical protein
MANYNSTKAFLQVERQRYKALLNGQKLLRYTALQTQTTIQTRVQQRGLNSSSTLIGGGKYSGSIIKPAFGKAKTFGSKRRLKKITGNEGYAELRVKLGRQIAYIDLTFSGDMFKAFITTPSGNGWAVGFTNGQSVIAGYNENRFGRIFGPTDQEYKFFIGLINQAISQIMS